jgi:hypothetical protein
MPPNVQGRLAMVVDEVHATTRQIMLKYNADSRTGHKVNYDQANKALNELARQGKILKNVEHSSKVTYFKTEVQ